MNLKHFGGFLLEILVIKKILLVHFIVKESKNIFIICENCDYFLFHHSKWFIFTTNI